MFSLTDNFIKEILGNTIPSFQTTCKKTSNLGFGFLFYSLVRTMRPKHIVVIGSKAGFSPIMFAVGLKDNEGYGVGKVDCETTELLYPKQKPTLDFIDPSYSLHRGDKNHWYGLGKWDNPENVIKLWKKFGVEDIITHYKMTSAEYLKNVKNVPKIDLLYIDGNHSYEGIMHDFTEFYGKLNEDALVIAHDVDARLPESGGFRAFSDISDKMYEKVRLPIYPGLAIMRKRIT